MRKAIIATLSVLIVLLFIACNTRVNYNKYLIAIDSLIVQQPDTALSMLEAFPTNSLQTQADSAYYGLLMTEARDKNYIIQTNDSLIQSALTYYNGTNDIEKRARAHYYSGCVYRDSQRRTESMTQYLIAKPLAEKAGKMAYDAGMRKVEVVVKGVGPGRETAIRSLQTAGLEVTMISDVTPIPHNGCRPPKRPRN